MCWLMLTRCRVCQESRRSTRRSGIFENQRAVGSGKAVRYRHCPRNCKQSQRSSVLSHWKTPGRRGATAITTNRDQNCKSGNLSNGSISARNCDGQEKLHETTESTNPDLGKFTHAC